MIPLGLCYGSNMFFNIALRLFEGRGEMKTFFAALEYVKQYILEFVKTDLEETSINK
jgi:hypothetical protein